MKGYTKKGDKPIPYHGYYFKILTGQGPNAPGGAYSYVINGHMVAGFALVAWPAEYGVSGVMTFIVNQNGTVYQKNLGSKTEGIAKAMTRLQPGSDLERGAIIRVLHHPPSRKTGGSSKTDVTT